MQKGALLVLFEDLIESFDNKEAEATVAHSAAIVSGLEGVFSTCGE